MTLLLEVTLATVSVPAVCVIEFPLPRAGITASSVAVGMWWSAEFAWLTQFPVTSQFPPVEIAQTMVANNRRRSIGSN